MADEEGEDRKDLAENRTDLAEDRTMLANERTFSGWLRTALAAIGIGVGFNALFDELEPPWVPKAVSTLFILLGVFMTLIAERRAKRVRNRLTAHRVSTTPILDLRLIAIAVVGGTGVLVTAIWILY